MGQRHLILVRLAFEIDIESEQGKGDKVKSSIIPLYHPWLYGKGAVYALVQFLEFVKNERIDNTSSCFDPTSKGQHDFIPAIIKILYSVNISRGTYNHHTLLEGKDIADDPSKEDNNDGVTFIDLSDPSHPRYCYFFMEGNDNRIQNTPLSAEEYIETYYDKEAVGEMTQLEQDSHFAEVSELNASLAGYELTTVMELCDALPKFMLAD